MIGSPPRRRGAHRLPRVVGWHVRITPASAGSTRPANTTTAPATDHPRVGGEHTRVAKILACGSGSPPRRRGAPGARTTGGTRRRTTPASAGSTGSVPSVPRWTADHPRVGGEHASHSYALTPCGGSPPHRRGAHQHVPAQGELRRITPASAGSTISGTWPAPAWTDHPRVGGEHQGAPSRGLFGAGPPPRRRGALDPRDRDRYLRRTTPTSAGSTS